MAERLIMDVLPDRQRIRELEAMVIVLQEACKIKDEQINKGWAANERHQRDKKRWAEKKHTLEFRVCWLEQRIRGIRAHLWDAVECFPRDADVVNVANMRHLFVFLTENPPYFWRDGR